MRRFVVGVVRCCGVPAGAPLGVATASRAAGTHRLPADWRLPPEAVAWCRSRGSGPGGQAVNRSMNKAELHVDLGALLAAGTVDYETVAALRTKYHAYVTKGDVVIVSSHAHRSLQLNEDECRRKVQRMFHECSYEPEPPVDIAALGVPRTEQRKFVERKQKAANLRKARHSVRMAKYDF